MLGEILKDTKRLELKRRTRFLIEPSWVVALSPEAGNRGLDLVQCRRVLVSVFNPETLSEFLRFRYGGTLDVYVVNNWLFKY